VCGLGVFGVSSVLWCLVQVCVLFPDNILLYTVVSDKIYGMFYSAFRPETWWWEGTIAARKIVIALIGVFGAEMESMQVHLTSMLVVLILLITAQVRPFGGKKHGLLHTLEMFSLMATFLTLWAGSVFNTFPRCEDPLKGEGFTLGWCDALSVTVGIVDMIVVVAFVSCFVYLKIQSLKESNNEAEGNDNDNVADSVNQLLSTSLDEGDIELVVNPFYTNERNGEQKNTSSIESEVPGKRTKEKKDREKRNARMKKVHARRKLSIGAKIKRKEPAVGATGEVKDDDEEEKQDKMREIVVPRQILFQEIVDDEYGKYFVNLETGDSVWELPEGGEVP
jgi:hypothetical protein